MFRAGSLLINSRINYVQTATGIVNIMHDYTDFCLYRVDHPDDEQRACSKHVEALRNVISIMLVKTQGNNYAWT